MKFLGVLILVWCAVTPLPAATVAIIDRSPVALDAKTAAMWDTLAATVTGFDSTMVIGCAATDSLLRARRIDRDMAAPTEIGSALGATKLFNVSIRILPDVNELTVKGRLYDVTLRRTVGEFSDSCGSGGDSPSLLAKIMAWTLASQLAPAMAPQRAVRMRDSLREAYDATLQAAIAQRAAADRRGRSLDSLVGVRTKTYDAAAIVMTVACLGSLTGGLICSAEASAKSTDASERWAFYRDPANPRWAGQVEAIGRTEKQAQSYHRWRNVCYGGTAVTAVAAVTMFALRSGIANRVRAGYHAMTRSVSLCYTAIEW